jgi:hypothetical protein
MEKRKIFTPEIIYSLQENEIFVFGSNLAGIHAGGAAHNALKWGAKIGQGVGLQGQTYAIPTMFVHVEEIKPYVLEFINFAKAHKQYIFLVTKIGCGIAGFSEVEIAKLFQDVIQEDIKNIFLPEGFEEILKE